MSKAKWNLLPYEMENANLEKQIGTEFSYAIFQIESIG